MVEGEFTTTLKELSFFRTNLEIEKHMRENADLSNYRMQLSDLSYRSFDSYRDRFCYVREHNKDGAKTLRNLPLARLGRDSIGLSNSRIGPRASSCYFLPSREAAFLGSEESRLNEAEIALFLKYLAAWSYKCYAVTEMVVDCHGALDLFMVGAILAADHVVIVTLPELGAYEGTKELMDYAKSVQGEVDPPSCDTLVINRCQDTDEYTTEKMIKLFNKSKEDVVVIRQDDELHRAMKRYRNPSIYRQSSIYSKMKLIAQKGISSPQQPRPELKLEERNVADEEKGDLHQ
jgi:hypothetical protein